MADIKLTTFLTSIADAIRYAEGSTDKIAVSDFADRIKVLSSQPSDYPKKIFRDITIIPDKYNTGCNYTNLEKYDANTSDSKGIVWRESNGGLYIDCNNGQGFRNILNSTVVFENVDFTNYTLVGLMNTWSESATYVPTDCHIIFRNCLFRGTKFSYPIEFSKDKISFTFEDCSMEGATFTKADFVRCKIGDSSYYRSLGFTEDMGFESNSRDNVHYQDCYFFDIETVLSEQGDGHIDGYQNAVATHDVTFDNCRFECIDMTYPSQGNWSYCVFWQKDNVDGILENCVINGGGYYSVSITRLDSQTIENNIVNREYSTTFYPGTSGVGADGKAPGFEFTSSAYITSIYEDGDNLKVICTNDLSSARVIKAVNEKDEELTFNISAGTTFALKADSWNELPIDRVITLPKSKWWKFYDGETLIRTYRDTDELKPMPIIPQPTPSENVPQSGIWQMKTTANKGYLIIGKDDDTADQAIFTRMVNGYGWPVTINTTWDNAYNMASHKQTPDTDSAYSLYPASSVSRVSEYCSVHDLNKIIIDNNLGEIAQHGLSAKNIWDSRYVTDDQIDYMYTNYTNGGGTKSRSEFWNLFMSTYADCDAAQGASYAINGRASLEADLGIPIRTLGCWGASGDREIDGIVVCSVSYLARGTYEYAREWNYWADGPVTSLSTVNVGNPYKITRFSGGLASVQNVESACDFAYQNNACVEVFTHEFFKGYGTATEWTNFKSYMDKIKEYVDDGKIEVVTRYQYAMLGEYVENPITSVSVSADAFSYKVGDTITEDNFTCKAFFADSTFAECSADRILDISQVDSSQAGSYTVTLYYRGKKSTCTVVVENDVPIHDYILENKSYSGEAVTTTTNICDEPDFVEVLGKTYHFEFDFTADVSEVKYSTHYISFKPASWGQTTQESERFETSAGTISKHFSIDFVCDKSVGKLPLFAIVPLNTTVTSWAITNLYCWEVTE